MAAYDDIRDTGRRRIFQNHKKAWSASGQLVTGTDDNLVHLQCNFEGAPEYYTLQFSINYPPSFDFGLADYAEAIAEVIWAVEGNQIRRLISITNGTVISGCGQGVSVRIYDWSNPSGAQQAYDVSVQVTKGARPSQNLPPVFDLNTEVGALNEGRGQANRLQVAPGTSEFLQPPVNAGINSFFFTWYGEPEFFADPTLVQFDYMLGPQIFKTFNLTAQGLWMPYPAAVRRVRVDNDGATAIIINPTFGVEG